MYLLGIRRARWGVVLVILLSLVSLPQLASAAPDRPPSRGYHMMAYDAESGQIILHGGLDVTNREFADTWTYDVGSKVWTDVTSPGDPPSGIAMAYDSQSDRTILFVDVEVSCCPVQFYDRNETWAYDSNSNTWENRTPPGSPPPLFGARMAYDAESDRVVLFGGAETWAYDYEANMWIEMTRGLSPGSRDYHGLTYDPQTDRVILFGGSTTDTRTWAYDFETNTWTALSISPFEPRIYHDMVWDAKAERIVLFGGVDYPSETPRDDTWAYDSVLDAWARIETNVGPSPRGWHAMAYDASVDRVVLFGGGETRTRFTDQTWHLDSTNATWTLVGPNPPVAAFSVDPGSPFVNQTLTLDAAASSDSDGTIISYAWDLGDGTRRSGVTVTHTYVSEAVYAVKLTVTDSSWLTDAVEQQVLVGPAPDTEPPVVAISFPQDGAELDSEVITVTGIASDNAAIAKVELSTDGVNWHGTTGTTSWSGTLMLDGGENTITARATDTFGNTATAWVAVSVPTPPDLRLLTYLVVAAVAAAVVVGVFLLIRRKRST